LGLNRFRERKKKGENNADEKSGKFDGTRGNGAGTNGREKRRKIKTPKEKKTPQEKIKVKRLDSPKTQKKMLKYAGEMSRKNPPPHGGFAKKKKGRNNDPTGRRGPLRVSSRKRKKKKKHTLVPEAVKSGVLMQIQKRQVKKIKKQGWENRSKFEKMGTVRRRKGFFTSQWVPWLPSLGGRGQKKNEEKRTGLVREIQKARGGSPQRRQMRSLE